MRLLVFFVTLLTICVVLPSKLNAQRYLLDQGSVRIAGSLSYANYGGELYQPNLTDRIESDRITEVSLRPSIAYLIIERLALGVDMTYISVAQNDVNNVVSIFSRTSWSIGPSLTYFFGEKKSPVFPFISMSYAYQKNRELEFERDLNFSSEGSSFRVAGGLAVIIGKQASLNFEAFYRSIRINNTQQGRSLNGNVFGLEIGASLFLY